MTPDNPAAPSLADQDKSPPLWLAMPLTAMAGGMGWGIRGQYGHETGAMLAGVLVALVLLLFFGARLTRLSAARAGAMFVLGIGVGGSMTYGQTVGLMHDTPLVGDGEAFRWGFLGLFIKGGLWISLAAALLGMGLSAVRHRPLEIGLLLLVMIALFVVGVYFLNMPFNPAERELPAIYFSDDWHWEPDKVDMKPRFEVWGGLLAALAGLAVYTRAIKGDRLAFRLLLWGFVAGGFGFSLGQCTQAYHAWNPEFFAEGWPATLTTGFNWWNIMEITFGAIFGATLALGVWLNRHLIAMKSEADEVVIAPPVEWLLVVLHVVVVVMWNFGSYDLLDAVADRALTMVVVPLIAVAAGRLWPYLVLLPITAFPIAGKTFMAFCVDSDQVPQATGMLIYLAIPLLVTTAVAVYFAQSARQDQPSRGFCRAALVLATLLYYGLNTAFFNLPYYWEDFPAWEKFPLLLENWTGRTSSDLIFVVCSVCLITAAICYGRRGQRRTQTPQPTSPPQAESA